MPRSSRFIVVLLLVLLLLPAALQAAGPQRGPEPVRSRIAVPAAWDALARLWTALTGDNGCWIDPNGRCLPGQVSAPTSDNGCRLDPDGRCSPGQGSAPSPDNGCRLDPSGLCLN
jgi:hypothetical protein